MQRLTRYAVVISIAVCCVGAVCAPAPAAPAGDSGNNDPIEPVNRAIFWFNDQVDVYVLAPVATGWDTIAPDRVQESVAHFFENLRFPIVAGNDLLQAKFRNTASDVGRFAVNTTVGVLGFFDPASGWGLEQHNEDFGQTLGYWGVPAGPYLVLPFIGPSSPREAVGLTADSFSTVYPFFVAWPYTFSAYGVNLTNTRAQALDTVREAKQASLDYYVAVRNAYRQRRTVLVNDGSAMSESESDELYNVEE